MNLAAGLLERRSLDVELVAESMVRSCSWQAPPPEFLVVPVTLWIF
jgi:hypothetical protein